MNLLLIVAFLLDMGVMLGNANIMDINIKFVFN